MRFLAVFRQELHHFAAVLQRHLLLSVQGQFEHMEKAMRKATSLEELQRLQRSALGDCLATFFLDGSLESQEALGAISGILREALELQSLLEEAIFFSKTIFTYVLHMFSSFRFILLTLIMISYCFFLLITTCYLHVMTHDKHQSRCRPCWRAASLQKPSRG